MNGFYNIPISDFYWESDWNGNEVGYDDIDVVGLYRVSYTPIYAYIDMENNEILELWVENEEDWNEENYE